MNEKYNKKILNVYKISFNIKCEMLFLVANLKSNKNIIINFVNKYYHNKVVVFLF